MLVDFVGQEDKESFHGQCSASREEVGRFFRYGAEFFKYETRRNYTRQFFQIVVEKLGFRGMFEEFEQSFAGIFTLKEDVYDLFFAEIKPIYDLDFCILSNTNELHYAEIYRRWPGIFMNCIKSWLSYELGCRKPEPQIYEIVLKDLQAMGIGAYECIFVDDLEGNVRAAKEAGIASSIQFESCEQLKAALASLGIKT